jgi:pilus assembly protein CpaF
MTEELKQRVHARLLQSPTVGDLAGPGREPAVRATVAELLRDEEPLLGAARFELLVAELTDEIAGLGPIEPLLADPEVTEVMVNGPGHAYVERAGRLERVSLPLDAPAIVRLVERVVAPLGLRLDRSSPMVDARLPDGSRVHAVIPPLAIDGPCLTIRRFGTRAIPLEAFGLDAPAVSFLRWAVEAGWNVLVAGGTSAGKTTLLNALSQGIPAGERIVTIEETAELRLAQSHVVRLEARPANAEGAGAVTVRELVRTALRMRPDRIVVGEVRGGEALDMLQALNTGHDGSLSTVHANSALDALTRLETLVLLADVGLPLAAIRAQMVSAVDAVVHVARRRGGARTVEMVGEVVGEVAADEARPLVRELFARRGGALECRAVPTRAARRPDAPPVPMPPA